MGVLRQVIILVTFVINLSIGNEIPIQKIFGTPLLFLGPKFQGSHFGWSSGLANYAEIESNSSWVMIGDPKANLASDPSYRGVEEPGAVWKCTLFHNGRLNNPPICETLNLDPILYQGECGVRCPEGAPQLEYHQHGWIGGSIVTTPKRIVISAHRWQRGNQNEPISNGLAYWFDPRYMFQPQGQLNITDEKRHRLIPLLLKNGNDPYYKQYKRGVRGDWDFPDFAYGEAGFSLHLHPEDNELLMGAPGIDLWKGGIVRYQDNSRDYKSVYKRQNAGNSVEYDWYRIAQPDAPQFRGYDYFGYAVTSGQYFWRRRGQSSDDRGRSYASGSPRTSDLRGEVLIYYLPPSQVRMFEEVSIEGTQIGAYFGSVLSSIDLNNDGIQELLIGAPFFDETLSGSSNVGTAYVDHGTVFLYASTIYGTGRLSANNLVRITSGISTRRGGRFGSAIVNLGDINGDGFNDMAIGAPFEDDGKGAVYIYQGKSVVESEWKPSIRIAPSIFQTTEALGNFIGFGSSFSVPMDIDHNSTPDFVIGSYLSQSVAIFRTRPPLDFETSVAYYTLGEGPQTHKQPISHLRANAQGFLIDTCIRLSGKALAQSDAQLGLDIALAIDVGQNEPRFSFVAEEGLIMLPGKVTFELQANCKSFSCRLLQAKMDVVVDEKSPAIEPIQFDQWINYRGGKGAHDLRPLAFQIHSSKAKVQQLSEQGLEPLTPFPVEQRIRPEVLSINSGCKNVSHCVPILSIDAWFSDESGQNRLTAVDIDWKRRLFLNVKLGNEGEPAYRPQLQLMFLSSSVPKLQFSYDLLGECQRDDGRRDYRIIHNCLLPKPLQSNKEINLRIPFTLQGIYAHADEDEIVLDLSIGVRDDPESTKQKDKLMLQLKPSVTIDLTGSVTQAEEAVNVNSQFTQRYEILLTGKSPVSRLHLEFKIPKGGSDTLLQYSHPTGNQIECRSSHGWAEAKQESPMGPSDEKERDEQGDTDASTFGSRRKRDTSPSGISGLRQLPKVDRIKPNENMTLLGCDEGNAASSKECDTVTCTIHNVIPNTPLELITFTFALSANETLNYVGDHRYLLMQSWGIVDALKTRKMGVSSAQAYAQTIVQFNEVSMAGKAALWIYIVSGIIGLIVLLLISFCLYKSGFFRRAQKQQLEERKAEVQEAIRRASILENPNSMD